MKFVKPNHRATLKNEHLEELICTALTTYCPDCRGSENQTKLHTDNYCTLIKGTSCVFVLTLQTVFSAHWCFWFSANDSSAEQVCPYLIYTVCKNNVSKKEALLPTNAFFATYAATKGAQMHSTIRPFT